MPKLTIKNMLQKYILRSHIIFVQFVKKFEYIRYEVANYQDVFEITKLRQHE